MKSSYLRGLCMILGLIGLVQPVTADEPFGSSSLLPMPSMLESPPPSPLVSTASYGGQEEISPSDTVRPSFQPPPVGLSNDYQNAMRQAWDKAGSSNSGYGAAMAACGGRPCPRFAVWGGGLILGRAHLCDRPVTQAGGTFQNIMGTNDAAQKWAGGFELGGAWIMPNCCNAIAVNYWGLFPSDETAYRNAPNYANGIRPVLANIDRVSYDDGVNTDNVFNRMTTDTGTHYITTGSSFNSVEVNFLGNTQAWGLVPYGAGGMSCNGCAGCGPSCWQFGWLGGFRYFRFNDSFLMRTDENDTVIGQAGDVDELRYRIQTTNSLLGFQMGGQAARYFNSCFSIYGAGRFGVFNNYITSNQYIAGSAGDAFINAGTYANTAYRFNSSRNALAGVGQLDLGMRYQMGCHWSLYGGYRVVALAGVATAPGQLAANYSTPPNAICAGGAVLLNGAFIGAQYAW